MRWSEAAFFAGLVASVACAPGPRWEPPTVPVVPPPPLVPGAKTSDSADLAAAFDEITAAGSTPLEPAEPSPPPAPVEPPGPEVTILLETPYKMDERPNQKTYEAQREDILDRRHWNTGGMGELVGEPPGPEGHPDPRVTVTVDKVHGPHSKKTLQRIARKYHWINVVRCYRLGAYEDPHLRGWTKARFDLSSGGKARGRKLLDTELKDRAVADCMVDKLADVPFGGARAGSRVWVRMKVSPGDEPMPPPEEEIVPGEGTLPLEAMTAGVEAGREAFEACYRAAFDYAPGVWGRIILRFHVTEHGKLDGAFEAGSRFPDARVQQCILHAARKLSFPKPEGGDIRFMVPIRLWTDRADTAREDG